MSVEDLVLKMCIWYKSGSIVSDSEHYVKCHVNCSGYDKNCQYYVGKQKYLKAKLETCKKLNSK